MDNVIEVKVQELPELARKYKDRSFWNVYAQQNLDCSKQGIERALRQDIPVHFKNKISLALSLNPRTLEVKIDYSPIEDNVQRKLVKSYLTKDEETFARLWMKLV